MLKQQAFTGTLWSGADALLKQTLQFAVSIGLARLLSPEEFGTIGLLSLFIGLANLFVNSGFSSALIQRQDISHTDESSVFWFNLGMGAIVGLLLWAAAPWIAGFFAKPILVPLTAVMGLNVFLNSAGTVHRTLLIKRLDFRTLMKVGVAATILSGGVGIFLAWRGFGVWALAWQIVASTLTSVALLWHLSRWRPAFILSVSSVRSLFGFGGYVLASGLLEVTYDRLHTVLIGKLYGVRDLGIYTRADATKQVPADLPTDILSRVAFPLFSAAAGNKERLRRGLRLATSGIMLVNAPMMLGLAAVAEPLVLSLFGARWLPAVPVLRVLCLGGVLFPLQALNLNALLAQGHSRLYFRLEVVKRLLGVVLLATGSLYGIMGIAWCQVAIALLSYCINAYYSRRLLSYGPLAQVSDFLPSLLLAGAMSVGVYLVGGLLGIAPVPKLLFLVAFGASVYSVAALLFRLDAIKLVRSVVLTSRPDTSL